MTKHEVLKMANQFILNLKVGNKITSKIALQAVYISRHIDEALNKPAQDEEAINYYSSDYINGYKDATNDFKFGIELAVIVMEKMKSSNDVPVERCTITAAEIAELKNKWGFIKNDTIN
jgi:hypothetical protein